MRRVLISLTVIMSFLAGPLFAYDTHRTDEGAFRRILSAETRGFLNLISTPLEVVRTPYAEARRHKWIWPLTMIPRTISNILIRTASSVQDIVISPISLSFSNDMTPLTYPLGLPDYAWDFRETDL